MPGGMKDDASIEGALLLELAKEAFSKQIAKRVRPLARTFVEQWMRCELWLYPAVIQKHRNELHTFKTAVIEVLRGTNIDDMLVICRTTRPDLDDLWATSAAREKLTKEVEKSIDAVRAL